MNDALNLEELSWKHWSPVVLVLFSVLASGLGTISVPMLAHRRETLPMPDS